MYKDKEFFMSEKTRKIKNVIKEHIANNGKEYIIVTLIFIIGIFLGVLFVNNINEVQRTDITTYFNSFIEKTRNTENIDNLELVKTSIIQNVLLAITLWFFGTTVIGIPIVFGIVLYRGFCLGYTISICVSIMGLSKGLLFVILSLVFQNILFIPAILALAVSGFKLYKSIIKDNRRENVKLEVVRHTMFSFIMMLLLVIASLIEIFISFSSLRYLSSLFN